MPPRKTHVSFVASKYSSSMEAVMSASLTCVWNFQSSPIQVLSGAHLFELAKQSLLFDIQHLEIFRSPDSRLHKIKATFESFRFSRTCQSLKVLLVTLSTLGWTHLLLSSVMSTCTWWRCASGLRPSLSAFLSSFLKKVGIPESQAGVVVTLGFVHCVILQSIQMNTLLYFVVVKLIKIKRMVRKPLLNVCKKLATSHAHQRNRLDDWF